MRPTRCSVRARNVDATFREVHPRLSIVRNYCTIAVWIASCCRVRKTGPGSGSLWLSHVADLVLCTVLLRYVYMIGGELTGLQNQSKRASSESRRCTAI